MLRASELPRQRRLHTFVPSVEIGFCDIAAERIARAGVFGTRGESSIWETQDMLRNIALAGAVAAMALVPALAEAAPGYATGSVSLRTGASTSFPRIAVIPAGARVDVQGCSSWCAVNYGGLSGYASANYIARGYASAPPRFVRPAPPRFGFVKRPWWDNRHNAWYDGRRWYSNGRWYNRPGFSLNFNFGG
jgi:uncharacterized protein YraI